MPKPKNKTVQEIPLPPYITITEPGDVNTGGLYAPVDLDNLMGQGIVGEVKRPYTVTEILASLPAGDRMEVAKSVGEGFSPVLIVDLLSGATAIEMRQHEPPPPGFIDLGHSQKRFAQPAPKTQTARGKK